MTRSMKGGRPKTRGTRRWRRARQWIALLYVTSPKDKNTR